MTGKIRKPCDVAASMVFTIVAAPVGGARGRAGRAVANLGIATYAFHADQSWWAAGIAGVIVGSVWNYTVS
jgi:hypothetical protein